MSQTPGEHDTNDIHGDDEVDDLWTNTHSNIIISQAHLVVDVESLEKWGCTWNDVYSVESAETVVPIATAMLNSCVRGHILLPGSLSGKEYDKFAESVSRVKPSLQTDEHEEGREPRVDSLVIIHRIDSLGMRFDVDKLANKDADVWFSSISKKGRLCAIARGLDSSTLMGQILDVTVADVLQPPPSVLRSPKTSVNVGIHYAGEGTTCEYKELQWWTPKPSKHVHDINSLYSATKKFVLPKLKDHVKDYTVQMYCVDNISCPRSHKVCFGVNNDGIVFGLPLGKDTSTELLPEIERYMKTFFPCPPMNVEIECADVTTDTTTLWCSYDLVLTIPLQKVPAIPYSIKDGGSPPSYLAVWDKTTKTILLVVVGTLPESKVIRGDQRSVHVDGRQYTLLERSRLTILDHAVISVCVTPRSAETCAPMSIFRSGSFSMSIKCGVDIISLSPFCSWAFVRHKTNPRAFASVLQNSSISTTVVCGGNVPRHIVDAIDGIDVTKIPDNPTCDLFVLVGLGEGVIRVVERYSIQCIVVDFDPTELQSAINKLHTSKIRADLICNVLLIPMQQLLGSLSLTVDDGNRTQQSPSPLSEEGRSLIKDYLRGKKSIRDLTSDELVLAASTERTQEEHLVDKISNGVTAAGPVRCRHGVCLLPRTGTSTMLRRVQIKLKQRKDVFALLLQDTHNAGELKANLRRLPQGVSTVVVMCATEPDPANKASIKATLVELKKSRHVGAVLFCVKRLQLFHDPLPDCDDVFVFDVFLRGEESQNCLSCYGSMFLNRAMNIKELEDHFTGSPAEPMFIALPGLAVVGCEYPRTNGVIEYLLQSLEDSTVYMMHGYLHRQYLGRLALLTAIASSSKQPVCLSGVPFAHDRWRFLLTDPTKHTHSLTSLLWAKPVLDKIPVEMTGVSITDESLLFKVCDEVKFGDFLIETFKYLVRDGQTNWKRWTQKRQMKRKSGTPTWVLLLGSEASRVLDALLRIDGIDKRTKIQLVVLLIDVERPQSRNNRSNHANWKSAIATVDRLLAIDNQYFLCNHKAATTYVNAVSSAYLTIPVDLLRLWCERCFEAFQQSVQNASTATTSLVAQRAISQALHRLQAVADVSPSDSIVYLAGELEKLLGDPPRTCSGASCEGAGSPRLPTLADPTLLGKLQLPYNDDTLELDADTDGCTDTEDDTDSPLLPSPGQTTPNELLSMAYSF